MGYSNYGFPLSGRPPFFGQISPDREISVPDYVLPPSVMQAPIGDRFSLSTQPQPAEPAIRKRGFSPTNALKNFGKGLVSPVVAPIQMMMESPTNFLLGASVLGAGGLLLASSYGAMLTPFLVAGGLLIGGYQGIKGMKAFSEAKTPQEKEKAFYEFGVSTASIGLSSLNIGALKRLLPGNKAAPVIKEESKIADIGAKVSGFHAAIEPLEQFGKVSGALSLKGGPGESASGNVV